MSGQTEIMWDEAIIPTQVDSKVTEWPTLKFDDVVLINPSEKMPKGTQAKKVTMDKIQPFTKKVKNYEVEAYSGGTKFRNGDTLLARITPCLENGKTAFVDFLGKDEVAFGSTEYIVIRERKGITDKQFLYYLAISPDFRDMAIQGMTGSSGRQRVETDVIRNHQIELPSLPEQRAIAGVLSSLDDKIDLLHRQNATSEALAETLFRQWFVKEAKEGWEERKVGDIATHLKVGINPVANPTVTYCQYSLPAYDNGQVPTRGLGLEILSNKYEVSPNTILISKLNPRFPRIWAIGDSVEANSVCSTEFQVFKPKNHSLYAYFYFLIKSEDVVGEMTMASSGTSGSHQRIRPEDILNIKVKIPSIEKAEEFSALTQGFIDKSDKNRRLIQTLSTLRDTLLPKLMSGEVRVAY